MQVKYKQNNSRMCVICGMDNPFGLQAPFYVMEDDSVMTLFRYRQEHQSYPGRVHGGQMCIRDRPYTRPTTGFHRRSPSPYPSGPFSGAFSSKAADLRETVPVPAFFCFFYLFRPQIPGCAHRFRHIRRPRRHIMETLKS